MARGTPHGGVHASEFYDAIDSYFKSTPPPEWTYLGCLKAIKPYCISEARSLDDQKDVWRHRYITYLSKLIIGEKNEIRKKYAICLIQQGWPPEEEDFWNDVKIEKELINEEVTFDKKSQMDALEVLDISRTQKAKEFVNKVSSKLGLKRTQKHSLTPPNKHARLSDNESEANASTSEDSEDDSLLDDNTERDLKNMTYDEFVKGFKNESNESNWKLKNGRRIIDVLTENVARVSTIFSGKSKKERTPYIRSVIRLGFSSIVDLSSEFQDGMYTWFEDDWHDIKKKVYETIDMVPKPFEDNVKTIIDTVEEMCNSYHYIDARDYLYKLRLKGESLKIRQIATIYFHVIDKFLEDPYIFMDKIGKPRGLSEIEYVMNMTAPILDDVFSDVKSLGRYEIQCH
ncbi:hypothetical protein C2G38_673991 [Gigaspora rosea]|uniref:Uncharacterized protein n=1 Tax=Gigaspora rosea TaxID=44941 RepID=A0A397U639_9GLOM|nr:hypothetical protein C2G38_673991 [Gigaspora rosea]